MFDLCIIAISVLLFVFIRIRKKSKLMKDHNKKIVSKTHKYYPSFLILLVLIIFTPLIISDAGSSDAFAGLWGVICTYLVILLVVIQITMLVFSKKEKVLLPIDDVNAASEEISIKKTINPLVIIIRVIVVIALLIVSLPFVWFMGMAIFGNIAAFLHEGLGL